MVKDDRLLAYLKLDGKKCYGIWHENKGWEEIKFSMPRHDGHPFPVKNSSKVVIDGYPNRFGRMPLYIASINGSETPIRIATFLSPTSYKGPTRCDLHPRVSSQSNRVVCDIPSPHGRKILILESLFDD